MRCIDCDGTGVKLDDVCYTCAGAGELTVEVCQRKNAYYQRKPNMTAAAREIKIAQFDKIIAAIKAGKTELDF